MIDVLLPQLSLAMEEARVARWLVADGALVAVGQPIVEIETDKAMAEVEAPAEGVIRHIVAEGAVVPVESRLAEIAAPNDAPVGPAATASQAATSSGAVVEKPAAAHLPTMGAFPVDDRKHRASPAARRIARDRGIDLFGVRGSGPSGRITTRDLPGTSDRKPSIRAAVVAQLAASWREIPHIHIGGELDGTGLAAAKRAADPGVTATDLLILALTRALRDVPELNGAVGKPSERIHLALAVAGPEGVVSPVIRDADKLSLPEIAQQRARLVSAARGGASDRRDLAGGTISLSNLGAYPVDFFAPVVSGPQIAMVATGRLVERAVAVNGNIVVRHRIWVNVAIDHRGADGVSGARFLAALERRLNGLAGSS